jgi:MFS family permease
MANQLENSPSHYGFGVKAAVISIIIVQFTQALATPALANIQMAFPDVAKEIIQQVNALPTLFMVVSSLLCGQLCIRIGYRKVAWITILLSLLGGVMPAFHNNSIYAILFWRAIFGLGYGLAFSLCVASIGALWSGSEQRKMLGIMTGTGAFCAMFYSTTGGYLAGIDWRYVFYGYFIIIPFGALIIAKLPEPPKLTAPKTNSGTPTEKGNLGLYVVFFSILAGLAVGMITSFMTNVAMVIIGSGMGEPKQVGFTMTLFSLGMAVGAFSYHAAKNFVKKYMVAVLILAFGIAILVMSKTNSIVLFTVIAVIYGACFGMINPEWERISMSVVASPTRTADGASVFVALQGIGQFAGPFLLAGIAGVVGFTGLYYQWNVVWPCLIVSGVVLGVKAYIKKGQEVLS